MKPNLFNFPNDKNSDSDLDVMAFKEVLEDAMVERRNMRRDQARAEIHLSVERVTKKQESDMKNNECQGLFVHPTHVGVN